MALFIKKKSLKANEKLKKKSYILIGEKFPKLNKTMKRKTLRHNQYDEKIKKTTNHTILLYKMKNLQNQVRKIEKKT